MSKGRESTREVILRTEQWPEAIKFYGSVLGLQVAYEADTMVGFETGAFRLYVEQGKPHAPVFEFLVGDVQAEKQRLIAAGCVVVEEDPAVPRCYLRDPFGLVFNLGAAPPAR
jgi:catechol 2,3-dioxygenase-like lactoylglutathione lyase family enzyme